MVVVVLSGAVLDGMEHLDILTLPLNVKAVKNRRDVRTESLYERASCRRNIVGGMERSRWYGVDVEAGMLIVA